MINNQKVTIIILVKSMKKNNAIIYIILILFASLCTYKIIDICVLKSEDYEKEYIETINRYITGPSAPRGKILDVNGKVLVDNIGINTVIYNKTYANVKEEIDVSYKLGTILKFEDTSFTEWKMKTFYLALHEDGNNLITKEERDLYNKRKLSKTDIESIKYERITEEMLADFSYEDKNAGYIYYLLSKGYYYEDKIIKKGITDQEVSSILDLNIPGIRVELTWERTYPYGETLKTLLGTISTNGVPKEYKEYYEKKGVPLNTTVGTSFLEFEYDDYLRGENAVYKLGKNGQPILIEEESPGSDIYLTINIDTQLYLESVMKEEMLNAKKARNSQYYNHSYAIIGDPKTGEIVAAAGLSIHNGNFSDITANIIHSSYTVGSIVKGATISVGYQQNLIKEGQKVQDSCIKVYGVTEKCSWTRLGMIDDIRALAQSSNYYQFLIATRLTNPNYRWNSKLNATKEHFDIYRNMLASYGLGAKTGIDLPNEQTGIIGKTVSDDLLLNLAIGQYDTYTPIEVFQYINTIATGGVRLAPSLMKKIVKGEEVIEHTPETLNKVDLPEEKIARVQLGLREVIKSGTGRNYLGGANITAAGKTGTSETFIDTNGDGKIDTKTTSTAFIMYAPFEDPKYSIILISPHIGMSSYKYSINLRINKKLVQYLFENS